jgi:sugar lactone lactonase YvrE
MNPAEPIDPPVTLELTQQFQVGGYDEEVFFGVIIDILEDEQGNIYMLDAQLNEIQVFDPAGNHIDTIGREGEGPGEFRRPSNLFWTPDGNIGVLQTFPSKIVMLTPDGQPAGEFPTPKFEGEGFPALINAEYAKDHLALIYVVGQPSESGFVQKNVLCLMDAEGNVSAELHSANAQMQMANPVISEAQWDLFRNRWAAASDGRVFAVKDFRKYEVTVWGPDGKVDRVIHREYPPHVRTDQEKQDVMDVYKRFTRQIPVPDLKYEVENEHPPVNFGNVYTRADGSFWVQTSRGSVGQPDDVIGVFDVFDPKGRFVRQVTLKGQRDQDNDAVFFVGDRLYVITDWLPSVAALQGGGGSDEEIDEDVEPMAVLSFDAKPLTKAANIPAGPAGR